MKRISALHRKPLLLALALTGAVGVAGAAFAQQSPSTGSTSPSSTATPSGSASSGMTRPDTAAGTNSRAMMPSRTESSDAAWQKMGSKGYITKDDVRSLNGFSFEQADANHDGRLTQDEFRSAWSTYSASSPSNGSSGNATPNTGSSTNMPGKASSAPGGMMGTGK